MEFNNKKSLAFLPVIFALLLITGIFIGIKLSRNGTNERMLLFPRPDKINSVLDMIEDTYVDSVSRGNLEEEAINSVLKQLDPHSVYIPASELQEMNEPLEGNFSGIGVQFNFQEDTIVIVGTVSGGPSEKVGVLPGDRIVKVNDTIVAGVKLTSDKIVRRLKGIEGTKVKIAIVRPGIKLPIEFTITRGKIPLKSIDIAYIASPGIGYLKISKFAKTSFDEFNKSIVNLNKLGMKKKLIIDLRGNGGGLLNAATDIADQFLDDKELIVYTKGRARQRMDTYSKPSGLCIGFNLVLLIDEYSASASEILAGALQDNDRATVIGRRSFGKGLVQEQALLPDGSGIRLTIARYYTPTGRSIQKPYTNGVDEYYEELDKRIAHGELEKQDSIHFDDSLRYKTPKGKIVYGGGGIMPDIFIPFDTSGISNYYQQISSKGILYRFGFMFSDQNRQVLKQFKSVGEMVTYLKKKNIFDQFVQYATKNGISATREDLNRSSFWIENQLMAYVSRNFLDNEGFYPILLKTDSTFLKAVEVLKSK